jgi:hypothetical protein
MILNDKILRILSLLLNIIITFVSPVLHQATQVTSSLCPESLINGDPGFCVCQIYADSSFDPLARYFPSGLKQAFTKNVSILLYDP